MGNETVGDREREPCSAKRRALMWAALCIGTYLIELMVFLIWTNIFSVPFDLSTMSKSWLFGFYGLLILPCLIGIFAFTKGKKWSRYTGSLNEDKT